MGINGFDDGERDDAHIMYCGDDDSFKTKTARVMKNSSFLGTSRRLI